MLPSRITYSMIYVGWSIDVEYLNFYYCLLCCLVWSILDVTFYLGWINFNFISEVDIHIYTYTDILMKAMIKTSHT